MDEAYRLALQATTLTTVCRYDVDGDTGCVP